MKASISGHRTEKAIRATHLSGGMIYYLYPLADEPTEKETGWVATLAAAARSVTHLGWGVDMVAADAKVISHEDADKLPGHRWRKVDTGGTPLGVPKSGTLTNLLEKHEAFLGRLSADGFKPVPPLQCFEVVGYHSPTVPASAPPDRPIATFEIHRTIEDREKPENSGKSAFRPYHSVLDVARVAGMVRHATATVARNLGWTAADVMSRVEGHGEAKDGQATSDDRLLFLPLPSIQPVVGVGGIRRVLVVGPPGFPLSGLRQRLNGAELIDRDNCQPVALLSYIPASDKNVKRYTEKSAVWSTVTPVILPGFDDPDGLRRKLKQRVGAVEQKHLLERLDSRILSLIWKSFHQAGWTADALRGAEIEYRKVGWFRGVDLAKNYDLPPLKYPRYHVRVKFPQPVDGPLAVGAGRYRGFGLFACDD